MEEIRGKYKKRKEKRLGQSTKRGKGNSHEKNGIAELVQKITKSQRKEQL